MLVLHDHPSLSIDQTERQTAKLGTFAPVGATPETSLTDITLPAIADTKSSMHEYFQRYIRTGFVYLADLTQRKFARQHHLPETGISQKSHLLHRTVIHLGTGVQRNRRQIQAGDSHILHNQCIYTGTEQSPNHLLRLLQFFIFQDSIDCHINPGIVQMGILYQSSYVLQ